VPEIEPAARPVRRRFPAEYKLAILAECDATPDGEKGSVLRREGMYSSQITFGVFWKVQVLFPGSIRSGL
jgi:hypothetical protein